MGIFSMSTGSYGEPAKVPAPGNPDPRNFVIVRIETVGDHQVVEIHYPNCKNYEGRKILVFANTPKAYLTGTSFIDPHFTDLPTKVKPIARFKPTDEGWDLAIRTAALIGT